MKKFAKLFCALSAVVGASQALALAPSVTPELTLTIAGASAQDNAFVSLVNDLATPGTLDLMSDSGSLTAIGSSHNAYFFRVTIARLNADFPSTSYSSLDVNGDGSIDLLVIKRSAGGSGEGPNGVCAGNASLTVDNTCTLKGAADTAKLPGFGNVYQCTGTSVKVVDGGLADLEVNKLAAPFNTVCDASSPAKDISATTSPIWATIFNTPVSTNLRDALQCAQGLTVGSDDEANMPSLPKTVIASIYSGGVASWNSLRAKNVAGQWVSLKDAVADKVAQGQCPGYDAVKYPLPTDLRVRACRRSESSGTAAQFKVKFLGLGCTAEASTQLGDNTGSSTINTDAFSNWQNTAPNNPTAPAIIEASSGGNMNNCIQSFADVTNPTTQRWAIGIQSTENNANLQFNYRFIKVDGVAPTQANVLKGQYFDFVESVWFWSKELNDSTNNVNVAKVAVQKVLLANTGKASQIVQVTNTNNRMIHPFGTAGIAALNSITGNVQTATNPVDAANPVIGTSNSGLSCRTPRLFNSRQVGL